METAYRFGGEKEYKRSTAYSFSDDDPATIEDTPTYTHATSYSFGTNTDNDQEDDELQVYMSIILSDDAKLNEVGNRRHH
jgi:hypothetical protein